MALIAVDGRFLGTGTGLATFSHHLLAALIEEGSHDYVVLTRPDVRLALDVVTREADIAHYSASEQTRLPRLVEATGADLAFYPHFNAPVASRVPYVITVHDLILHRHAGGASILKQVVYRTLLHGNLRRARGVIAVSEWTRQDLIRHYGAKLGRKCSVSGEGPGPAFSPRPEAEINAARHRLGLNRDYLLYVGNAKPHKNIPMLVAAHSASQIDADLVLVTGDPAALPHASQSVVVAAGVDDDTLAALYTGARAFVTASLDEGYCLPVAEALACGCPVIASECGAIPETAGGNARLLPPRMSAWVDALRQPVHSQAPVRVGEWADAAERTVEAFEKAM